MRRGQGIDPIGQIDQMAQRAIWRHIQAAQFVPVGMVIAHDRCQMRQRRKLRRCAHRRTEFSALPVQFADRRCTLVEDTAQSCSRPAWSKSSSAASLRPSACPPVQDHEADPLAVIHLIDAKLGSAHRTGRELPDPDQHAAQPPRMALMAAWGSVPDQCGRDLRFSSFRVHAESSSLLKIMDIYFGGYDGKKSVKRTLAVLSAQRPRSRRARTAAISAALPAQHALRAEPTHRAGTCAVDAPYRVRTGMHGRALTAAGEPNDAALPRDLPPMAE